MERFQKIRITGSTAHKVPIKDTTDSNNFVREHLYPKFIGNKFTKHGQENEILAKEFLVSNGYNIEETGLHVSPNEKWLSASPDGILDGDTVLEIKSPFPSSKWTNLKELFLSNKYDVCCGNDSVFLKEKGNRGYYMQTQLTMFCTGLRKCKLLVWVNPHDFQFVDVEYNLAYINEHLNRLRTFYIKKMLPRIADEFEEDRLKFSKLFIKFL